MTTTQLLDLPNELFFLILEYLSPIEILTAFFDLHSYRIQALIQPFIYSLDISEQDDQWIQTYLPGILSQRRIRDLRLLDPQINFVSKYLSIGDVQSIRVIVLDSKDESLDKDLVDDCQCLKKLSIMLSGTTERKMCQLGKYKLIKQFFPMNSNSEYFSATGEFVYPTNDKVYTYPYLTYLSIEIGTFHELFIILQRLPNLKTLKVNFPSKFTHEEERITDVKNVIPCTKLRSVTFTGYPVYFFELSRFFEAFGSTIESLTLILSIQTRQSDGMDLERGLLNKMPRLSSLNLHLYLLVRRMGSNDDYGAGDIKTFQTAAWLKLNPVICWPLSPGTTIMIYTLPYIFDHLQIEPDEFASSCAINQPVPICFEHLHSLIISHTGSQWTIETFKFIQAAFPHVKRLYFTYAMRGLGKIVNNPGEYFEIFSDDLIENNTVQLLSITELKSNLDHAHYNNKTLRCLFHLLPNLTVLRMRMHDLSSFLEMMQKPGYYDDFVMDSLNRIELKNQ